MPEDLRTEFVSQLASLERTRTKVERAAGAGSLGARDVEKVYEALYLRAFTYLEALVETLFMGLLTGRIQPNSRAVRPRVAVVSDQIARALVYAGHPYVDWFPYDRTLKLAKRFFRGGRPFVNLSHADQTTAQRLLYIRNAIAHKSQFAQRRFRIDVIGGAPLRPHEKSPAGFLRSKVLTIVHPVTRYESSAIQMADLARKLCP